MWLHLYFAQRIAHRTTLSESLEPSTAKAIRWYTIFLFSEHSIIGLSLYLFPSLRLCWKFYTSSSYFYEQPPPSLFAAHVITYTTNIRRPPPPPLKERIATLSKLGRYRRRFLRNFSVQIGTVIVARPAERLTSTPAVRCSYKLGNSRPLFFFIFVFSTQF